jgi:hypothetical protein
MGNAHRRYEEDVKRYPNNHEGEYYEELVLNGFSCRLTRLSAGNYRGAISIPRDYNYDRYLKIYPALQSRSHRGCISDAGFDEKHHPIMIGFSCCQHGDYIPLWEDGGRRYVNHDDAVNILTEMTKVLRFGK